MAAWGPDRSHGVGLGAKSCPNFFDMSRKSTPSWLEAGRKRDGRRKGGEELRPSSRSFTPSETSSRMPTGDDLLHLIDGRMGVIESVLNVAPDYHLRKSGSSPALTTSRRSKKLHDWRVAATWGVANGHDRTPGQRSRPPTSQSALLELEPTAGPPRLQPMRYACHPPTRSDPCRYAASIYRPLDASLEAKASARLGPENALAKPSPVLATPLSRYAAHPATRSDACRFAGNLYRPLNLPGEDG